MADRVRAWLSLPLGVVNLSERHAGGRDVSAALFAAMVEEAYVLLEGFPEGVALDRAVAAGGVHMLGTSGTVTTLAGVHLKLPRYDRRRVDGVWLSGAEVADLVGAIVAMDYAARVANPCIGRERADLVLAGCAILEAIRRRWPCERLRVADRGLREGVLVELMAEDGVWRPGAARRWGDGANG
jgi:exopolyphosphatase/guanosine-5'-triphosphate,3'-diphosphate pyrophosphatase